MECQFTFTIPIMHPNTSTDDKEFFWGLEGYPLRLNTRCVLHSCIIIIIKLDASIFEFTLYRMAAWKSTKSLSSVGLKAENSTYLPNKIDVIDENLSGESICERNSGNLQQTTFLR